MTKSLLIANPTGICGGVRRAIEIFERLVGGNPGKRVYVLHELVHNRIVTQSMREMGAEFVEEIAQVPTGGILLLGAHGCGPDTIAQCRERGLEVHDAVCPMVAKLHQQAIEADSAIPVILLGDPSHSEIQGVLAYLGGHTVHLILNEEDAKALPKLHKAVFLSQTTRSFTEIDRVRDILLARVDSLEDRAHVCDAVFQRQKAVLNLAKECQQIFIVGSENSSNARRLVEVVRGASSARVSLIEGASGIQTEALSGIDTIGLGAATSTPDSALKSVADFLESLGYLREETR